MLYLNSRHITALGVDWPSVIEIIGRAAALLVDSNYEQPLKPYLHLGSAKNRIIAMPAYLGGEMPAAGIKWISSFPGNSSVGKPRAHAITVLNDVATGEPVCLINSTLLSAIRTAAVSGLMIRRFLATWSDQSVRVGIVGLGEIGTQQLAMILQTIGSRITAVGVYDIDVAGARRRSATIEHPVSFYSSADELLQTSDVFITCTTSPTGYIRSSPLPGSLIINVSLRDFVPEFVRFVSHVVVDDWTEVCRKGTDIEAMHRSMGLQKSDTICFADVARGALNGRHREATVMFNPMGLAVFDIAITDYYRRCALSAGVGENIS